MNIFFLSLIPKLAAQWHCDKHVVKMVLEAVEILYVVNWKRRHPDTTWIKLAPLNASGNHGYKLTHPKHPSVIWAGESKSNYIWLCDLARYLHDEYKIRYNKIHASEPHITWLRANIPHFNDNEQEFTQPKLAMTPDCKEYAKNNKLDPIKAYRYYYITKKMHFISYRNLQVPDFLKEHFSDTDNYNKLGLSNPETINLYRKAYFNEELKKETKESYGIDTKEKENLLIKAILTQKETPKKWNECANNSIKITNAIKRIFGKEINITYITPNDKKNNIKKRPLPKSEEEPPIKKPKIN